MVKIIVGDALETLKTLEAESVHCVVTSPPYWGLRDYGVEGQLGMEKTPEEHVGRMVEIFREVRRVLRGDGVAWLNYGDSYASRTDGLHGGWNGGKDKPQRVLSEGTGQKLQTGLKPKDLIGMPWRVAFALQSDGWWLRSDVIWHKPNPMPESVTDRPTKAHEYVFLLTKAAKYHYDTDAVREPLSGPIHAPGNLQKVPGRKHNDLGFREHMERNWGNPAGRNLRDVWTIATNPYSAAHFATFPPRLAELCIKAGCPKGGTVLDPFGGAGTVGLVADRLGRGAVLIELNEEYAEMARKRIYEDCPMFTDVGVTSAQEGDASNDRKDG
jgi:DNA modification methylase